MSESLTELTALREATRVRLAKDTVHELREWAQTFLATDQFKVGHGLSILLDMHDKLEMLRHGS